MVRNPSTNLDQMRFLKDVRPLKSILFFNFRMDMVKTMLKKLNDETEETKVTECEPLMVIAT